MKKRIKLTLLLLAIAALLLLAFNLYLAPNAIGLTWWTVDGGGSSAVSGSGGNGACYDHGQRFAICGTVGQPDANHAPMQGGNFKIYGGFWSGKNFTRYDLFLPVALR